MSNLYEIIKYTTSTNNTLTVVARGLGKTSPTAHNSGKIVYYLEDLPKSLFINELNKTDTTIKFDIGCLGDQGITGGLFCINSQYSTEFIGVDTVIGYNKNTHNKNNTYALSYLSNYNYISKEIITTTQTLATTPDITSGTTSTYYLIGSAATTSDELDTSITSVSTIGISSINYTYPSLASATTILLYTYIPKSLEYVSITFAV